MLFRRPTPVRAAEGGGGGSPVTPAPEAPATPAAPADGAAPAAPGTLLTADPAAQPTAQAAEGQPQGDAKPGDKPADGKEGDKPEAKPLTAEDFASGVKMPDDLPVTNPEGLAAFRSLAAEAGLSVDQAQRIVDFHAGQIRAQQEAAQATISEWGKQAAADKEFGGEAFAANAGIARQALQAFATPALVELFNQTGIGNHPEMIRAFYRVGKAMAEDGRVAASGAPKGDRLAALYPTMVPKE